MTQHDPIGEWWQYVLAGVSTLSVGVASHLKVRDRVKTLEIRQDVIEARAKVAEDTHDTVIRLDSRMLTLETDLRNSSEAFAKTMQATGESQARMETALERLGGLIKP
jgi:hypothetical protein